MHLPMVAVHLAGPRGNAVSHALGELGPPFRRGGVDGALGLPGFNALVGAFMLQVVLLEPELLFPLDAPALDVAQDGLPGVR